MKQAIAHVALVVREYDEAVRFFTEKLDFMVVEDKYQPAQDKRWVLVTPPGSNGVQLLLARATTPEQERAIRNQTGGRVFLFLQTDDFWRDYKRMRERGIEFVREPKVESYGTVSVFKDLYGNLWDLVEFTRTAACSEFATLVPACGSGSSDWQAGLDANEATVNQLEPPGKKSPGKSVVTIRGFVRIDR